ncbi:gamma-tubulin complex component 4-like [Argopecten irradians]|uniref:gamma-tubulin complex component 4-like n=1 Tax=Argopecten irradians TaxID=31199 RepID=UPI0037152DDA
MLHEILFALSGHSGGLFVENNGEIKVLPDVPFICPSEIDLLNKLCQLGTHYRDFNAFIKKHGGTLSLKQDGCGKIEGIHGLYLKSFCHGLDQLLDDYRQALHRLEMDTLQDPHLPMSHLLCSLQEYHLLFPALATVVEQICNHKAHGCYILDILHKNSMCGLPVVKLAMHRILHVCHAVMYKQLCSWLLHGVLIDPYLEFFIQHSSDEDANQNAASQEDDDDLGLMGVTGRQLQRALSLTLPAVESSSGGSKFSLRANLLPVYIPVRVANKILFTGEAIQMFESDKKPNAYKRGGILKNKEEEFARDLYEMSKQEEFNGMMFESMVDKIRTYVAEHLWSLVVKDSDLLSHLKIIKDFYLLGRGELFLAFIDQTQTMLRAPPMGTTEHDINTAFQQSARNVLIDDEELLQRFRLTVAYKPQEKSKTDSVSSLSQSGPVESGWSSLGLAHTVQWPLHIFFTPKSLQKYNRLFCFLLAVRRAQMDIQQCWVLQMQFKQRLVSREEMAKWQLRTHMSFLVDNLQYYLQVDVIESQYGILVDKINSTRDFEAVRLAHDQFLSALLSQSFIHSKPVSNCLSEILEQCGAFSHLLTHSESPMSQREISQLHSIEKSFQLQSNLLFKILSSVRSHNASPHLAQLLLRLDFNKYFTTAGGQLGRY